MRKPSIAAACLATSVSLAAALPGHVQAQTSQNQTSQDQAAQDRSQSAYFDIDGDHVFYKTAGTGFPVLLIHGFPLSHVLFENQQLAFSAQYRVITVDLPGFGQSSTATSKQTEVHYAREMLALLAHLGITKAAIGGHSMGGQVTLEMYRQNPQLFRAMILFDTNPAGASIVEKAEFPAYGRMAEKMGSASIAPSIDAVMVTGASVAKQPELQTELTAIVSAAMPAGVAGGGNALATRPDFTAMLGSITVPALVVVGQDDPVYPLAVSQALAAAIPGSTLAVIPNANHASMFQSPGATNAAINAWIATIK